MGRDAIEAGKKSLLIASGLIFCFMWLYYGTAGLLANLVTAINVGMIFAILGSLGATLTLPGIAGIVLTIGMAVDALIIIFERMRDEIRIGRSTRQVVEMGFGNAFRTILDSNVTTAIGAYILLEYGTGSVRGFAITLLVGITTNVFMATSFAKIVFDYIYHNNKTTLAVGLSDKDLAEAKA
jgi:preprotein translocase subunit SecD